MFLGEDFCRQSINLENVGQLFKFQSMSILAIPLQLTAGNSFNVLIKSQITKLDHYFWNSIDNTKVLAL